ncbi:MAG TPA: glycosyltransferase [Sedimenticola thiotaurini]|uniref:Glycosyltransferase n=1 Tax=Sedimenticola thiotaurini TaxID=1543721 RepID=A0A831W8M0_9GAMM|nr:glycosyltransferase [Sedimenticola thiotaurini]
MTGSWPTVSVVIPTCDRAEVLPRALDSVLAQTRPPLEIVVVDDGSSDGTPTLLRRAYPGVRLLRQRNRGVSSARNRGIRAARGDWIALLDSDDEWLPHKLERQLALLAQRPGIRLCHGEEIWIRDGRRVNPGRRHAKSGGHIFDRCLELCVISPSAALIHRTLLQEVGTFDESLPACEDYDLWLRICAREPVAFVREPVIRKFGGHPDQLSRRFWGMDRFRVRALEKLLRSGVLSPQQQRQTIRTLQRRAEILARGAARRGRRDQAARWLALRARWNLRQDGV